jgi:hypothetical protein
MRSPGAAQTVSTLIGLGIPCVSGVSLKFRSFGLDHLLGGKGRQMCVKQVRNLVKWHSYLCSLETEYCEMEMPLAAKGG